MLEVKNLHVEVEGKQILNGIDLNVKPGEMHAIMGLNGSGKSTLSNAITGRENYSVTKGDIIYKNESIVEMEPNERALAGIFMSFQYPTVIPGVNNTYFLRAAVNAKRKYNKQKEYDAASFLKFVKSKLTIIIITILIFLLSISFLKVPLLQRQKNFDISLRL